MKKFFLSFAFAVLAIASAFAGNETLQVATAAFWGIETAPESGKGVDLTSADEPTLLKTQGDVTLSLDKASATTNFRLWNQSGTLQFRTYKNSTMTIEAGGENITAINIVGTGFATSFTANAGELTSSASEANWTGSATSVVITTAVNAKIFSIEVVYGGSTPVVTVATPVISGTTPFDDETEVSISCETTGASIYYTLDGSTPDNQSTQYTGAFDINATTTVKAIAYKDNTASSVASKVFTMNPKRVDVGTVDALNKLADGTEFTYISDVVVTGQTGQYLYVQDETAATLIYGQVGQTYNFGDVIMQGWTGKKVTFKGAPEMTNLAGFQASFFTAEVPVKEFDTKTAASLENFSQYGVIKNVTIDLEGKKLVAEDYTEIAYYDRFKVAFPEVVEGKKFNVNIIVGYYDAPQVYPVAFEEVVEPEAPQYSLVGWINGANYACEEDYENPGQYVFDEEGKLTVNFEMPSYVFVKTTDNSKWFLTENYVPFAYPSVSATFANGANFGEKMQVPAGEVEFTLTVTDENNIVLTAAAEEPVADTYFMKHPWGGEDWTWKELAPVTDGQGSMKLAEDADAYYVEALYGGNGVNVNTVADDAGATWYAEPAVETTVKVGDLCRFTYFVSSDSVQISKVVPTAINDLTVAGAKVYKTIENGEVIIVKDGVKFNVMGQKK